MRSIIIFAGLVLAAAGLFTRSIDSKPDVKSAKADTRSTNGTASAMAVTPVSTGRRSVTIPRDNRGHFQVEGRVDGRRVGFMVDTGASVIALTESEAGRLGIRPSASDFTANVSTANGTVRAARVTLNAVDIGGLVVRDVQALVVPGKALSENLLGLSYLTKLKRFEYSNGKMVLEQ